MATNHKQNLIALAEHGKNPGILIHHKVKEQQWRIDGIATLEINRMVISNEGRYLMLICGTPDNCLKFYNLEKREPVTITDSKVEIKSTETIKLIGGMN